MFTDDEIIEAIMNDKVLSAHIDCLYVQTLRSVRHMIHTKGGSQEDADDAFQEAMCIVLEIIKQGRFRREAKIRTLLYKVSQNLWADELERRKSKNVRDYQIERVHDELGLNIETREQRDELLAVFKKLDDTCKDLLVWFYFFRKSYEDILQLPEYRDKYSSLKSISKRKTKCWDKLMTLLEEYKKNKKK